MFKEERLPAALLVSSFQWRSVRKVEWKVELRGKVLCSPVNQRPSLGMSYVCSGLVRERVKPLLGSRACLLLSKEEIENSDANNQNPIRELKR